MGKNRAFFAKNRAFFEPLFSPEKPFPTSKIGIESLIAHGSLPRKNLAVIYGECVTYC
jgi:hypothetical protein